MFFLSTMWSPGDRVSPNKWFNVSGFSVDYSNCSLEGTWHATLFVITYGVSIVVGVPANLMALCGICHLVKSRILHSVYLLNLTVADLLYLSILPLWILYFMRDHRWVLGTSACKASGTLYFINMYASVYFLCCIAVERCLAIAYPLKFQTLRTVRCYVAVSLVGWLVIIMCQVPIIVSAEFAYSHLCYQGYVKSRSHAVVTCAASVFGFLCPSFLLLFCYHASIRGIEHSSVARTDAFWIKSMLLACLLTFLSCFGPYHCISLVHAVHVIIYGPDCDFVLTIHSYYRISVAITSLNTVLDPLLYVYFCKDLSKHLEKLCRCGR
ncbi:G-protein coupled receptor 4-like [Spea bombifrons]|uniref:G-protein coupled receptor 4-like n=1 Tax=Spea bombifrons TaxID=233779 RepID=UPI002349F1AF|nr:G-protein coupled receptor 4-like [Spea bombifrons]